MELLTDITDYQSSHDRVLTVGTFDGVHLGHQKIIEAIIESAKKRTLKSTVVTFDPHPKEVISTPDGTDKIELLTTLEEKLEALSKFDIDTVIVIFCVRNLRRKKSLSATIIISGKTAQATTKRCSHSVKNAASRLRWLDLSI